MGSSVTTRKEHSTGITPPFLRRSLTGLPPSGKREQTEQAHAQECQGRRLGSRRGAASQRNHAHASRQGGKLLIREASAAGLTPALFTPVLSRARGLSRGATLEKCPRRGVRHKGHRPADSQNTRVGQGRGIQHLQRAGQDRRTAGVDVGDLIATVVVAAEDDRAAAGMSITLSWPGPLRTVAGLYPHVSTPGVAVEPSSVAGGIDCRNVAGGRADRDRQAELINPCGPAWSVPPVKLKTPTPLVWTIMLVVWNNPPAEVIRPSRGAP